MVAAILTIEIVSLAVLALLYWRAPHGFEDARGFHFVPHPTAGDRRPDAPSCIGAAPLHDTRGNGPDGFGVVGVGSSFHETSISAEAQA